MKKLIFILCFGFFQASFASSLSETPLLPSSEQDPLEAINRPIFAFNQTMDYILITPATTAYNKVVPNPIRAGVNNFFDNISMISTTANDILQGELKTSITDAWRFIINSTLGIGGLIDVASEFGLPKHFNDMGLTFAKWGYRNSTYIVVPFLGSGTIRDGIGLVGDGYLSPYPYLHSDPLMYSLLGFRYFTVKANLVDAIKMMNEMALDPYVFARDAYYQYRAAKINSNLSSNSQYMYLNEKEPQDEKLGSAYVPEEDEEESSPVLEQVDP